MTLIKCPECGAEVSDVLSKCPKCNSSFENYKVSEDIETQEPKKENKRPSRKDYKWGLIFLMSLAVLILIIKVIPVQRIFEQVSSFTFFDFKGKKAIEIVKNSKIQIDLENVLGSLAINIGLGQGATWQDFANLVAKQDPSKKYVWTTQKTDETGVYIVAFQDEKGWGHRWEVNMDQQTVNHINHNEYLSRKYGFSRFDRDGNFEIVNIETDTLKVEKDYNYYSAKSSKHIVYILKATVKNKTGKALSHAEISGKLVLIYKDKTVKGESGLKAGFKLVYKDSNYELESGNGSGFKSPISLSNLWKPNTDRPFYLKTKGIDEIYMNYQPEYVFFEIGLEAEDPIGFKYDKDIEEFDLKNEWGNLKP